MSRNWLLPALWLALPVLLIGVALGPFVRIWERFALWVGWVPTDRSVDLDFEGYLQFFFSGGESDMREGIAAAFDLLVALLPRLGLVDEVSSLEVLNPESGMVVRPEKLQRVTRSFGEAQAILLMGESLEYGKLKINDALLLDLDELDLRSQVSGSMAVLLSKKALEEPVQEELAALRPQFGFRERAR